MNTYRLRTKHQQRGAAAILLTLTGAFLIAIVGIAIDSGRMYVARSELQSAMDSCALAAASQLQPGSSVTGPNIAGGSGTGKFFVDAAAAYGRTMSNTAVLPTAANKAFFQKQAITPANIAVEFSDVAHTGFKTIPVMTAAEAAASKFVRCSYTLNNLPLTLVVLGKAIPGALATFANTVSVPALATASRSPGVAGNPTNSTTCGLFPMLICAAPGSSAANDFGYAKKQWIPSACGTGNATCPSTGSGSFGWLEPTTGQVSGSSCANGAACLGAAVAGNGICGSAPIGSSLSLKTGVNASVEPAWNSRFGLYKNGGGSYSTADAPPDYTGFSYDVQTNNQYPGTGTSTGAYATDYLQRRLAATVFTPTASGFSNSNFSSYNASLALQADYRQFGKERRIISATFVDCSSPTSGGSKPVTVKGYGCFFLLSPFPGNGGSFTQKIEYLGQLSDANTPCSLSGVPGGGGGTTPGATAVTPYLVR
jgi:Putative Flp pilus-assembly TadE/G-like